jgi:uncharacterized protein YaeQ
VSEKPIDKAAARRLIAEAVDSFEKLEVVSYAVRTGYAVLDPDAISTETGISTDELRAAIAQLRKARVLARALEHSEGLEFSKGGVSDDEEPALVQRDLRGDLQAWIEVGNPTPDRLHKAAKACRRVVVYTWKDVGALKEAIRERKAHRGDEIELKGFDPDWLDRVAGKLERNNAWDLSVSGGAIYLTIGEELFETTISVA